MTVRHERKLAVILRCLQNIVVVVETLQFSSSTNIVYLAQ